MRYVWICLAAVACGGPRIAEPHVVDLAKTLPSTLETDHPKTGDPRQLHVRVWADAAVRAQPHWKEDITEQIDYASQLLTPMLGVRIVVDAFKDWDRTGEPRDAAKVLAKLDDAADVTWVIGYLGPNEVASKAMSELGDGPLLGHHIAVRGWAEKPETVAIVAKLHDVKAPQRAEVLAAHKRHKQTVVLLHMLAASLGAIEESDPTWIGNPTYSPKQSTFSDHDRELMQLAVDDRLNGGTDQSVAHDVLEVIEKQDWGGWVPGDHDDVVKTLRNVVDAGKAGKTAADVPAAVYDQFDRIRTLRKTNATEALIELDNLLSAYPGNATMYQIKCEIMLDKPGVAIKETRAACARVSELAPGDPSPHFAVGEALARAGDAAGAHAELAQGAAKIGNLTLGQPEAWKKLVGIYMAMGALTWTEEALAAGKLDGDPAAAVIAQARARYGVPRGTKVVKPDSEAALVTAVRGVLALVYGNKFGDAERALAAGEKKWPGAPGFAAARCDLALRRGEVDAARAACQRAVTEDPDESWALYLGGVIALKDTSAAGTNAGIAKLKKSIEVDPDLGQAWRALARAYDRANNKAALVELGKAYQAKFQTPLPQ